jgi:chromosome partitioning protein
VRCLAVVNQKGGVGKTTVATNLAAALAARGFRVLLVDLDPQGHATEGLGLGERYDDQGATLASVLLGAWDGDVSELLVRAPAGFDVIPSNVELFVAEPQLVSMRGREHRLARILEPLHAKYDWCLVDCPPSLGVLTDNAVVAGREVLVVVQAQDSSLRAFELLLDQLDSIRDGLDVDVAITGIVLNLYEDTNVSKRVDEALAKLPVPVLARLRRRVKLQEAWAEGRSILDLEPHGHASVVFRQLVDELVRTPDLAEAKR